MFNSPGAYSQAKARHDLDVLAQLREQLSTCSSLPADDAAALSTELLGLARAWLDQLAHDAEVAGATDLRSATAEAAALAADPTLDAQSAAAQLGGSLERIGQTLDHLVASPAGVNLADPRHTTAESPADGPTLGTHQEPAACSVPEANESETLSSDALPVSSPTFPTSVDAPVPSPDSDSPQNVAAPTFPPEAGSGVMEADPATPPPTFPVDPSGGALNFDPALPELTNSGPADEVPTQVLPGSSTRFAETMTFPPELDDRVAASGGEVAASLPRGHEPVALVINAPAPMDDGLATLDALNELSRQLEQMCPRWGIETTAATPSVERGIPEPSGPAVQVAGVDTVAPEGPPVSVSSDSVRDEPVVDAIGESPVGTPDLQPSTAAEPAHASAPEAPLAVSTPVEQVGAEEPLVETPGEFVPLEPLAEFESFEQSLPRSEEPTLATESAPAPAVAEVVAEPQDAAATTETFIQTPSDPAAVTELTPEQMAALMGGGAVPESPAFSGELTPEQMAALMADGAPDAGGSWGSVPLQLTAEKLQALQFVVAGVSDHFKGFRTTIWELAVQASREDGAELLKASARKLGELTSVCDFAALSTIRELMIRTAESICAVPEAAVPEVLIRVMSLGNLIDQALRGLEVGMELRWPLDTLAERLHLLLRGEVLHPELQGWHGGDAERLLELDRVSESFNSPPAPESSIAPRGSQFTPSAAWAHIFDRRSNTGDRRTGGDPVADRRGYGQATLRVPVSSVERMASMVADLVVTKNQILGVLERLSSGRLTASDAELARAGSGDLARLTSGLDVTLTMMQVRLQNLGHLFDRFPRVIRDVASVSDKNVELRTDAGSVQVDKGMFDAMSDPLGQLLRAVVTRSIETPAERAAAGKPAAATIDLRAESKGTRVLITIAHDGRPTPRAEIIERAIELEMLAPETAQGMSDQDVLALEFDEHYCDPDMAQVAAKIRAINGEITVRLAEGQTSYVIAAPLGVAVLDAVMVGVDGERYGIPLANVEEISQVCEGDVSTVRGRAVLRRRDGVVALIDMRRAMGMAQAAEPERRSKRPGTAVVIKTQHHRAALLVTRVLAKEELVVRSLSAEFASAKIFSGATISGDGKVNLIVDPDRLAEHAHLETLRDE